MITNEAEIRVALQAALVSVLTFYGFWGCAVVVFLIMLPWKPIFAVGGYLAQPVVDWRIQKARLRHEKGMAQIEKQLDAILLPGASNKTRPAAETIKDSAAREAAAAPGNAAHVSLPLPMQPFKARPAGVTELKDLSPSAEDITARLAIPPVIKDHVSNLPQGVFNNMDLEVEDVKFHGEMAEAYVRFQSPSVAGLAIRQRYQLRKSGDRWQVESRQPANGGGAAAAQRPPSGRVSMRLM